MGTHTGVLGREVDVSISYSLTRSWLRSIKDPHQLRGEVDVGGCLFLNGLDRAALAARDNAM